MRFENSPEMDVSRLAGSSPEAVVRTDETVGSDSSSETNGSSVAIVAGKNRLPASPCASPLAGQADNAIAKVAPIRLQPMNHGAAAASACGAKGNGFMRFSLRGDRDEEWMSCNVGW